ncbi:MAG: hypothetical protein KDE08_11280 [Rhodobacteraceae bacterium]|nr:hypothetical protein [Paracoccaceae bacterium]
MADPLPSLARTVRLLPAAAVLLATAGPAAAQDRAAAKHLALLGIDSATVAPAGTVFGSVSVTNERLSTPGSGDGSAELGFGLGSAEDSLGFQVTAVITSLRDDPGDSGYLAFKVSRQVAGGASPVYLGAEVEHLANWGDASGFEPTGTLALTKFGLTDWGNGGEAFPYMLTLGVGSHLRNGLTDPGVFVGAGIGISESLAVSAAWTGQTVDLGASLRIAEANNMTVAATLSDVFDQEDSQRVILSFGWYLNDVFGR